MLTETRSRSDEAGFTLLEMAIVLLVATVVLVSAVSTLTSLANAASRNEAVNTQEQSVSTTMAQLERDIRSATSISFPSGASPQDELQLAETSGGTNSNLLWVYNASLGTLTREAQVNGAFQAGGSAVDGVSSAAGTGVFKYYGTQAGDISATPPSNIAMCATAVGIDLQVTSTRVGVGSFEETAEVALTQQADSLTTPGGDPCGS